METSALRVHERLDDDPRRGFPSHREFLQAVMRAHRAGDRDQVPDYRLRAVCVRGDGSGPLAFLLPTAFTPPGILAAAGSDEQGGYADRYGGFLRGTATAPWALSSASEGDPTAGRTRPVVMDESIFQIPARVDNKHSTSVSGGLTFTRKPEAVAATSSRGELAQVELAATTLLGLAYATGELLDIGRGGFISILAAGFGEELGMHLLREKIRGLGGGEFLGVLNSPAKITVAKEGGQSADTILAENVVKMAARCWGYGRAIWLANHDTRSQLAQAAYLTEGSAGGGLIPVFQPSTSEDSPDFLHGRPCFFTEFASTLGDEGDLICVNWMEYLEGIYQPLQRDESVHVRWENHESAFKFWLRNAGAPWWHSALTPNQSTTTLSPIVTLAERA